MPIRLPELLASVVSGVIVFVGVLLIRRVPTYAVGAPPAAPISSIGSVADVVTVDVRQGDSADTIARRLQNAGVIQSTELFRELAALEGLQDGLAAGQYSFQKSLPVGEVLSRLHQGSTGALKVTIPEGRRVEEVADLLDKAGVVPAQEFLAALQSGRYAYDFLADNPAGSSLEGYIFPDTYNFPEHNRAEDVVNLMLKDFGQRLTPDLRSAFKQEGLSIHDAVALASIVEREAQVPGERPTIASVYFNRLRLSMPLQADPTVQFALAQSPGNVSRFGLWKKELLLDDLRVDSAYNTYLKLGLPPGPIANPGRASLEAVAHPAQAKYLFFVAKDDGSHVFAETFAEHQANIAKYQR